MYTDELVEKLDRLFNIHEIQDISLNGLQVANKGSVHKVALAVDVSLNSIIKAKACDADFLFVHHGLFWGKPSPIIGPMYQKIKLLIESGIALYAVHLPLDVHPELGNNAQIENKFGWPISGDFGKDGNQFLGKYCQFDKEISLETITQQIQMGLNIEPLVWAFGTDQITRLGYISGGGLSFLDQAIEQNLDVLVTGESKHGSYWAAHEAKINVIFAGHYATETLGVKAVGGYLEEKFELPSEFIDLPTGQ